MTLIRDKLSLPSINSRQSLFSFHPSGEAVEVVNNPLLSIVWPSNSELSQYFRQFFKINAVRRLSIIGLNSEQCSSIDRNHRTVLPIRNSGLPVVDLTRLTSFNNRPFNPAEKLAAKDHASFQRSRNKDRVTIDAPICAMHRRFMSFGSNILSWHWQVVSVIHNLEFQKLGFGFNVFAFIVMASFGL